MRIQATGPGRRGTIDEDGVGRLLISGATGHEAKKLAVIYEELRMGNLGYWSSIMWGMQTGLVTESKVTDLNRIMENVRADFAVHCGKE